MLTVLLDRCVHCHSYDCRMSTEPPVADDTVIRSVSWLPPRVGPPQVWGTYARFRYYAFSRGYTEYTQTLTA